MPRKTSKRKNSGNTAIPPRDWKNSAAWVVAGVAVLGLGLTAVMGISGASPLPGARMVPGIASIDEGLARAGAAETIVKITEGDGQIDLIYAGAPECIHCQRFMSAGFTEMVAFAAEEGLDFAYMPMASSVYGVNLAAVEICAAPSSTLSGADLVRASYAGMDALEWAAADMNRKRGEGAADVELSAYFDEVLNGIAASMGATEDLDMACHAEASAGAGTIMNDFRNTFGLEGTPSFWFTDSSGSVRRITGSPDLSALRSMMIP